MLGAYRTLLAAALALLCSSASAAEVPLASLAACGGRMEVSGQCATCGGVRTFVVGDAWHGLAQCFRSLRNAWSRNGAEAIVDVEGRPTIAALVRAQVRAETSGPGVGVSGSGEHELLWRRNDLGAPYNAMGQTGAAYFLYNFADLAGKARYPGAEDDAKSYTGLARAAARTVFTPVEQGGLATYRDCGGKLGARCAWYHSVTSRDRRADGGGTLNQMLHAVRDFGLMADLEIETDRSVRDDYERAVDAGLNQLFYGTAAAVPTLADFVSDRPAPASARWAYYAMSLGGEAGGMRGYFLKQPGRNCGYQVHSVALLRDIVERQKKRGRADLAASDWLACRSPAMQFYNAIRLREETGEADRLLACDAAVDRQMADIAGFYGPAAARCDTTGK